jgi:hypothetical protein
LSVEKTFLRVASFIIVFAFMASACTAAPTETATLTPEAATEIVAATEAPSPSETPGLAPALEPVSGTVAVSNASCRVGPGGGYLLRAVLHDSDPVDILGQMELNANWLLIRVAASGAHCWINTDLLGFEEGSPIGTISDPHIVLPYSTYYSPLRGVRATRNGDFVRVRWDPMVLREGDTLEETPYLLAAWVCQNGSFVFRSVGSDEYSAFIRDEQTCSESSHGLVMGAEKRGYTSPVVVQWP